MTDEIGRIRDWAIAHCVGVHANGDIEASCESVRDHLPEALWEAWMADAPSDGMIYVDPASHVTIHADDTLAVRFQAVLTAPDWQQGFITRRLDPDTRTAEHALLKMPPGTWGSGYGKGTMRRCAELYPQLGIERIAITPAHLGRYIWTMCGAHPSEHDTHKIHEAIAEVAEGLGYGDLLEDFEAEYLWDYTEFSLREDGTDRLVTRQEILDAVPAERLGEIAVPPAAEVPLGHALLIYNRETIWEASLSLETGNPGLEQLQEYTGV